MKFFKIISARKLALQHAVIFVSVANLLYFFVEFEVGRRINSVSLFADSIDFLEDAAVNLIVLLSLYLSFRVKQVVSVLLSCLLIVPIGAAFFTAWEKLLYPSLPLSWDLSTTAMGALLVNFVCALILAKVQHDGGSLSKAAFLSSRNDAYANLAMVMAGFVGTIWPSYWPDLLVGVAIAVINLDSAKEILQSVWLEKQQQKK